MSFKQFLVREGEFGPSTSDVSFSKMVEKYGKDPSILFTFGDVEKVGVNYKSYLKRKYFTPMGVYAYTSEYMEEVKYPEFPPSPRFYHVLRLKSGLSIMDSETYKESNLKGDVEKLEGFVKRNEEYKERYAMGRGMVKGNRGTHFDNPFGTLWTLTRCLSDDGKETGKSLNPVTWTKVLSGVLGYDVIIDRGMGVIHKNEPSQVVVFSAKSYDVIETGRYDEKRVKEGISVQKLARALVHFGRKGEEVPERFVEYLKNYRKYFSADFIDILAQEMGSMKYFPEILIKKLEDSDVTFVLRIIKAADYKDVPKRLLVMIEEENSEMAKLIEKGFSGVTDEELLGAMEYSLFYVNDMSSFEVDKEKEIALKVRLLNVAIESGNESLMNSFFRYIHFNSRFISERTAKYILSMPKLFRERPLMQLAMLLNISRMQIVTEPFLEYLGGKSEFLKQAVDKKMHNLPEKLLQGIINSSKGDVMFTAIATYPNVPDIIMKEINKDKKFKDDFEFYTSEFKQ
jgi:hypothetical protein